MPLTIRPSIPHIGKIRSYFSAFPVKPMACQTVILREEHLSPRNRRIKFWQRMEIPDRNPEQRKNGHQEDAAHQHDHWARGWVSDTFRKSFES